MLIPQVKHRTLWMGLAILVVGVTAFALFGPSGDTPLQTGQVDGVSAAPAGVTETQDGPLSDESQPEARLGPSGTLPLPGSPTFGPVPIDLDGDGEVSGEGDEAYPDFVPAVLDDGQSVGYVEYVLLDRGPEPVDPDSLGDVHDGDVLSQVSLPAFDTDGNRVGWLTLELTFGDR